MGETFKPRYEVVGSTRNRNHEIKKGPVTKKVGHPRKSRVIEGLVEERAEVRYVPLLEMSANDIDTASLPHVSREAAMEILADAAFQINSLATTLKRKTTIATSPTVKENRSDRPLKVRPNATVYDRRKMEEAKARNELKRMYLDGEISFSQLALIIWGSGYSLTEPNFVEPALPARPFPSKKLKNIRPEELREMKRQHKRNRLLQQGNIYHR